MIERIEYMKTPVAVALIIVGGLLIATPPIFDQLARAQVTAAMQTQNLTSVSLSPPPMSSEYRFGCWFVGGIMVAAAVIFSRRTGRDSAS